jgi:hypothetical protein
MGCRLDQAGAAPVSTTEGRKDMTAPAVVAAIALALALGVAGDDAHNPNPWDGTGAGPPTKKPEPKVILQDYFPCHEPTGATPGMRF